VLDLLQLDPAWLAPAIFFARIIDVSLGTFRAIMVIRGHRLVATGVGFIESLLWIMAIGSVMTHLDTWYLIVAYAAGFTSGNYVGIRLEARIGIGSELVRAISIRAEGELANGLREAGWETVAVPGTGPRGEPVDIVLAVQPRRRMRDLLAAIHEIDPRAVYTTSDLRRVHDGGAPRGKRLFAAGWPMRGKGK